MTAVDRSDEVLDMYAEDQRREAALDAEQHPDDPGPVEPPDDDAQDGGACAARTGSQRAAANGLDGMPRLWDATDLKPAAQPRWLARGRIPSGTVSLLCGDEGIGKSLFWVWIVAAITTGKPLPAFGIPARDPSHVVLVCTEDSWTFDVCPRLEVAGADCSMIQVICVEEDGSGAPIFPRDLFLIYEADPNPALVIVDAWLDTVPANLQVRDIQQARQALHPWKEVASSTGAAVLLLCHTNRISSGSIRDTYGATYALRQKVRMALYAVQDDEGNLVLGPDKANGARAELASVFHIKAIQHFPPTEDHDGTVPQLAYLHESDRTIREHVLGAYQAGRGDGDEQAVDDWLTDFLKNGPQKATAVFSAADATGYSKDKAKRAKARTGVVSTRPGGEGPWLWELPAPACTVCTRPVMAGQGDSHLRCREGDQ